MRRTLLLPALLVLLAAGCTEPLPEAPTLPVTPGNPGPVPSRVLVVNTLSETLSSLDLDTRTLSVRAADVGTWANRVTALPDRRAVLVAASGDNEIQILHARDFAPLASIDVGRGSSPWIAVAASTLQGVVTSWLSGEIRLLNLKAGTAGRALRTTPGPEGVAVSGGRAFVACTNWQSDGDFGPGVLEVVDLAAWRIVASVPVGRNPQDVLLDSAGRVHVLCTGTYGSGASPEAGSVRVIDPASLREIGSVALGGSPGRFARGSGDIVWVAGFSGGLRRYDATTLRILPDPTDAVLLADGLSAVAFDEADGLAYVTSFDRDLLIEVDGASLAVTDAWVVGDGPVDVLVFRQEN